MSGEKQGLTHSETHFTKPYRKRGSGMIDWCRLTIENQNHLIERAKKKADGVFSSRGILFRVVNGGITHYAAAGKILVAYGRFNSQIGTYKNTEEARKLLKAIQKG